MSDAALHATDVTACLATLPGLVGHPYLDSAADTVTITFDATATGPRHFLAALRDAGFYPELARADDPAAATAAVNIARAAGAPLTFNAASTSELFRTSPAAAHAQSMCGTCVAAAHAQCCLL